MKNIIIILIVLMGIKSPVDAQVDTLVLSEIDHIQIPANITEVYLSDLAGDSTKEIILCSSDNIYIYESQTHDLLWTSPSMDRPRNLRIDDINHDGHPDIVARDSLGIYIYDIFNSQVLWTSPVLDSTYCCFTSGDTDNNGYGDITIVRKEVFSRFQDLENRDTVWVDIYNGPDFNISASVLLLVRSYSYYGTESAAFLHESPIEATIANLSAQDSLRTGIFLFTALQLYHGSNYDESNRISGCTYIINPDSLTILKADDGGQMISFMPAEINNNTRLYTVAQWSEYNRFMDVEGYQLHYVLKIFLADSLLSISTIWQRSDSHVFRGWDGFLIGDANSSYPGDELYFCAMGELRSLEFPQLIQIWTAEVVDSPNVVYDIYHNQELFDNPQIMYGRLDRLFDGGDGHLTAIFADQGISLSGVSDIDNDGTDELLSISTNTLNIYHAEIGSSDANERDGFSPYRFMLQANYPNPFNPTTTISYNLSQSAHVTLEIYDILGRKVETLVDKEQPAGPHKAVWNAGDRASGIYFYRIQAGDIIDTKRMLLLR